jgi:hypothetical protein
MAFARAAAFALTAVVALAGCGGGGGGLNAPHIAPARTFGFESFNPSGPVAAGRPVTISFSVRRPDGRPLTAYRKCCEPHAGVDLIIVRSDDSHVQYDDSDITASGRVSQPVVFPAPGRYRIVADVYPAHTQANGPINFQLFNWVTVRGSYHPSALPPYKPTQVVGGYRFRVEGHPHLKALAAQSLVVDVTDRAGHPARFEQWRGALAHAIFIHHRSLDYFHTHVCSPGARYCGSVLGATKVTGTSSTPGRLRVGVLLPTPGTWRLFLLTYIGGRHITTPFTLHATS